MYTVVFKRFGTVNIPADTWLEAMEIAEHMDISNVSWSDEVLVESAYEYAESDS